MTTGEAYLAVHVTSKFFCNAMLSSGAIIHHPVRYVTSGVPQGTVLDLFTDINSTIRLFADDCLIYRVINSSADHQLLQQDLNVTGFDKSRLGCTHQANSFSTTNRQVHPWANN